MKLYLNNVGIVKDSEVKLEGLTVITGKNSSGKTTVGKTIYSLISAGNNTVEAFEYILRFHSDNGITSAVASTVTAPQETIQKTLEVAREVVAKKGNHAKLLGVHLEGPYLSFQNKGAHAPAYLRTPAEDDYSYILENADINGSVPSVPALRSIEYLTSSAVTVLPSWNFTPSLSVKV